MHLMPIVVARGVKVEVVMNTPLEEKDKERKRRRRREKGRRAGLLDGNVVELKDFLELGDIGERDGLVGIVLALHVDLAAPERS